MSAMFAARSIVRVILISSQINAISVGEALRTVEVYIHVFLTSEPVRGEWSLSRPGRFTPGKEPK
jgi:hypothetical protein